MFLNLSKQRSLAAAALRALQRDWVATTESEPVRGGWEAEPRYLALEARGAEIAAAARRLTRRQTRAVRVEADVWADLAREGQAEGAAAEDVAELRYARQARSSILDGATGDGGSSEHGSGGQASRDHPSGDGGHGAGASAG